MESAAISKISKACEPCRRRKVRCSGGEPCAECRTTRGAECLYRAKPRVRASSTRLRSERTAPSHRRSRLAEVAASSDRNVETEATQPEVFHSVAASHHAPQLTDSSQLFYGPSSTFAFLQQIHRLILSHNRHAQLRSRDVQEGGPGLDAFMQRTTFFGTPPRVDVRGALSLSQPYPVSRDQARDFLEHFKTTSQELLPFLTSSALDELLLTLDENASDASSLPQRKAILLMFLAIGALSTPLTDLAEMLFISAKREAIVCEDAVTLPMIQFSLLVADYQINMGRPNSAYLQIGLACRKAFALGLHTATTSRVFRGEELQEQRRTLWVLYFYETWICSAVGRKKMMTKADISCPFPDDQPVLVKHCQFAVILEQACDLIYTKKPQTLHQLYATAENLYTQLRQWSDQCGLRSGGRGNSELELNPVTRLMLNDGYFYAVLLTFRPFLIAESAMQLNLGEHPTEELWIRQACRHAIDAAQDCIIFVKSTFRSSDACRNRRYNAFFLEVSCAVLLYDSLRCPSKYAHNLEYIQTALECLGDMVNDVPVTTTSQSIQKILRAVEHSISLSNSPQHGSSNSTPPEQNHSHVQFPSLSRTSLPSAQDELIFFSEGVPDISMGAPLYIDDAGTDKQTSMMRPSSYLNFDVLTTDLFTYFPTDRAPFQ